MWRRGIVAIVIVLLVMSGVGPARAQGPTFSRIVVVGDSLSDNGNLYAVAGALFPPYYWNGRISNGPVMVEYLAQSMGIPLADFAWAAATTGLGNTADGGSVDGVGTYSLPGMTTALQQALSSHALVIDPDALYVVWGGPNDFWSITSEGGAVLAIQKAVANLVAIVGELRAMGARDVLVLNMPDLGRSPRMLMAGPLWSSLFTALSATFNAELKAHMPAGVRWFDDFGWMHAVLTNPSAFGFTNVSTPCFTGTPCSYPNGYLFWDDIHPTTAAHTRTAEAVLDALAQTVVIGQCDSGVPEMLVGGGVTLSEWIDDSASHARNHGQFVSDVASLANELKRSGILTGRQAGALLGCAAKY